MGSDLQHMAIAARKASSTLQPHLHRSPHLLARFDLGAGHSLCDLTQNFLQGWVQVTSAPLDFSQKACFLKVFKQKTDIVAVGFLCVVNSSPVGILTHTKETQA